MKVYQDSLVYDIKSTLEANTLAYTLYDNEPEIDYTALNDSVVSVLKGVSVDALTDEIYRDLYRFFKSGSLENKALAYVQTLMDSGMLNADMSLDSSLYTIHSHCLPFLTLNDAQPAQILEIECALIHAFQSSMNVSGRCVALDIRSLSQQRLYAIYMRTEESEPCLYCLGEKQPIPFEPSSFQSYEFLGQNTVFPEMELGLNQIDFGQSHDYITPDNSVVRSFLDSLFPEGYHGMSEWEILTRIYTSLADSTQFVYQREVRDEWRSVESFLRTRQGDCEEFAHAQMSLALAAFEQAGISGYQDRLAIHIGSLGRAYRGVGHAVMRYTDTNGQSFALDPLSGRPLQEIGDGRLAWGTYVDSQSFQSACQYTVSETKVLNPGILKAGLNIQAQMSASELDSFIQTHGSSLRGSLGAMDASAVDSALDDIDGSTGTVLSHIQQVDALQALSDDPAFQSVNHQSPSSVGDDAVDQEALLSAFRDAERSRFHVSQMHPLTEDALTRHADESLTGEDLSFLSNMNLGGRSAASFIFEAVHRSGRFGSSSQDGVAQYSGVTHRSFDALSYDLMTDGIPKYDTLVDGLGHFFNQDDLSVITQSLTSAQQESLRIELIRLGHAAKSISGSVTYDYPPVVVYTYDTQYNSPELQLSAVPSFLAYPEPSMMTALQNMTAQFEHKTSDLFYHTTSGNLNKYVDQNESGFVIYDFARINRDYTMAMDALQYLTAILDAVMSYQTMIVKCASYIADENLASAGNKIRSKLAGAIKKYANVTISRNQTFVDMFVSSWDAHNQSVYKQYDQEITRKFKGFEFLLGNVFLANEFMVQEMELRRHLEAEFFSVQASIRENYQRTRTPMHQVKALFQATGSDYYIDSSTPLNSSSPSHFWAEFQATVQYDIAAGVKKQVPGSTVFVDAFDYYFPFYSASSRTYYNSALETIDRADFNVPPDVSRYFDCSDATVPLLRATEETYNNSAYFYHPAQRPTFEGGDQVSVDFRDDVEYSHYN